MKYRPLVVAFFVFGELLMASAQASATSIIEIQGGTLGCFNTVVNCSSYGSPVSSSSTYDLTFVGSNFDIFTDATGAYTNIDLGTLTRGNTNVSNTTAPQPFTLQVTFTLPSGIAGGQADEFTALITGTNFGGGGALNTDIDNTWQLYQFTNVSGTGQFEFAVINDPQVQKNHSETILGGVRNASFTPAQINPTPVPEPSSIVLLGLGLVGVATRIRRSRM